MKGATTNSNTSSSSSSSSNYNYNYNTSTYSSNKLGYERQKKHCRKSSTAPMFQKKQATEQKDLQNFHYSQ